MSGAVLIDAFNAKDGERPTPVRKVVCSKNSQLINRNLTTLNTIGYHIKSTMKIR